ncbi:MAG: hypothetical protein HC918_01005 [Oscillatoriales cyanobacterium SM2_1_8]|nr:hypothetical protein [Oscillatoriales cyanobacterium SM2_1_8]
MNKFSLPQWQHLQTKLQDTLSEWDAQALAATERAIADLEAKLPHDLGQKAQKWSGQVTQNVAKWLPKKD